MKTAILIFAFSFSNGLITIDKNRVTFDRQENGLVWPLPENTKAGILLFHGYHCFDLIQLPHKQDNRTIVHRRHCRKLVEKILHFLKNETHRVNAWMCDALSEYMLDGMRCEDAIDDPHVAITDRSQNDALFALAYGNKANLMFKDHLDPSSLTTAERGHLKAWETNNAIAVGAIGVYCRVKGNVAMVQAALDKSRLL